MEKLEVVRIKKLSELIAEIEDSMQIRNFKRHEHSNGNIEDITVDEKTIISWLCRPKDMLVLLNTVNEGNCVGDCGGKIAISKQFGLYFITQKFDDEKEVRLLKAIGR